MQNPTARRVQLDSRTAKITIPITNRAKLNSTTVSDGAGGGGSTVVSASIPGRRGSSKGGPRKEPNSLRGTRPMGSLPRSATRKAPSPDSLNVSEAAAQHRMHFVVSQSKRAGGVEELRKDNKERPHTSAAIGAVIPPHIREIENLGMSRREQILAESQALPRKHVFRPPPPGFEG